MNKWAAYAYIFAELALCMAVMWALILLRWGEAAYREWWL